MNMLDLLILATAAWGFYRGLRRGMIYLILSLAAIVVGFVAASRFSGKIVPVLADYLDWEPAHLQWLAYFLVFFLVLIVAKLVSVILEKFLDWTGLGWLNRLTGALLSAAKYLLIIGLLLSAVDSLQAKYGLFPQDVFRSSSLYRPLVDTTRQMIAYAGDWSQKLKASLPSAGEQQKNRPR
ncbi:MAG: CvpA family protein [Chlorobi bacterium]|nr:CvpA family protein [Chlorobiota bacterium]